MSLCIRIIRPASREKAPLLPIRIKAMQARGYKIFFDDIPVDPSWPFVASSSETRLKALTDALLEPESQVVLAARGGYGVSDLLADLPWERLKKAVPKFVIGFSDISALHSALYCKLGWKTCIHGPMAASELWDPDSGADVMQLWDILEGRSQGLSFPVQRVVSSDMQSANTGTSINGWLFGGNLSVLTNILATQFFPKSLKGAVVFLEDIGENPGRLVRQFTQWLHLDVLKDAAALVLGGFNVLGKDIPDHDPRLLEQFRRRSGIPTFSTTAFGHLSPNSPIIYGAEAIIAKDELSWKISEKLIA